jgi:hypothetical protein
VVFLLFALTDGFVNYFSMPIMVLPTTIAGGYIGIKEKRAQKSGQTPAFSTETIDTRIGANPSFR